MLNDTSWIIKIQSNRTKGRNWNLQRSKQNAGGSWEESEKDWDCVTIFIHAKVKLKRTIFIVYNKRIQNGYLGSTNQLDRSPDQKWGTGLDYYNPDKVLNQKEKYQR